MTKKLEQKTFSSLKTIDARFARSKKNNLSLLRSSKKSPQNFSTNLLFLWNNLSRSETSQKFQTNLVNFVTNFANFFLQKNIYFESKNHPKTKRLKNLKFCELCEKYFVNSVLQKLVPFRKTNSVNLPNFKKHPSPNFQHPTNEQLYRIQLQNTTTRTLERNLNGRTYRNRFR